MSPKPKTELERVNEHECPQVLLHLKALTHFDKQQIYELRGEKVKAKQNLKEPYPNIDLNRYATFLISTTVCIGKVTYSL